MLRCIGIFAGLAFIFVATSGQCGTARSEACSALAPGGDAEVAALLKAPDLSSPLATLLRDDQADRSGMTTANIIDRDALRRKNVSSLLKSGRLFSGSDYEASAFIFQHGQVAQDYIFAHMLAITALDKDDCRASWIAAASLDRYLQATGSPQVYGTQLKIIDQRVTQEPFDSNLMSEAMRLEAHILSAHEMERRRAALQARVLNNSAHQ